MATGTGAATGAATAEGATSTGRRPGARAAPGRGPGKASALHPITPARAAALRPLLDRLDASLDRRARLAADPVELPRRYRDPADQEVAGLLAAALAYGRADLFKPILVRLLDQLGPSPARAVDAFAAAPDPAALAWFRYRFNRPPDLAALLAAVGWLRRAHGSLGGARILLVEDDWVNREIAVELIDEVAGLPLDVAESAARAIDMVQRERYDLILMDVLMPDMDGYEATRQIRRLPGYAATPIVAMTANAFAEDRQRCLDAGMNDHIAKPVDPGRLREALHRWLPEPRS